MRVGEKIRYFIRKPFFIYETEEGIYNVAKAVILYEGPFGLQKWLFKPNQHLGQLVLDEDTLEIPAERLSVIIKVAQGKFVAPYLIEEIKRLGRKLGADYVSNRLFGSEFARYVRGLDFYEVRPRFFVKAARKPHSLEHAMNA